MVKALSRQSVVAFRLLIEEDKMMSAKRIGRLMGISQQNTYRVLEPLVERQLVVSGNVIGRVYRARQRQQAQNAYATYARQEFDELFGEAYSDKHAVDSVSGKLLK